MCMCVCMCTCMYLCMCESVHVFTKISDILYRITDKLAIFL